MKAIIGLVVALVIVVGGYLVYQKYAAIQQAATGPAKEIASESMTRTGNTWDITFVSKFDAPIDKVWEAFTHPERIKEFAPENVMQAELVKEEGNTKQIRVVGKSDVLPPGFKIQDIVTEYTLYPDEHRIASKTIDFKLADIDSEYRFEPTPDGKTVLRFKQTAKQKAATIVESLQKGALREQYIVQVRAANKALGLVPAEAKREAG